MNCFPPTFTHTNTPVLFIHEFVCVRVCQRISGKRALMKDDLCALIQGESYQYTSTAGTSVSSLEGQRCALYVRVLSPAFQEIKTVMD